jgi:protein-disulfide isomerase-like protein with CxxC motif
MAADAKIWVDPMCPWAWMTSRWMVEASQHRDIDITWGVMSLAVLNDGRELPEKYVELMKRAWGPVRILIAARETAGQEVVGPLYEALGMRIHNEGRGEDLEEVMAEALAAVGLPAELLEAATSTQYDDALRASHAEGIGLVGTDVGTPVLGLPGPDGQMVGYFGPVVTPIPRGDDAIRLWDAMVNLASVPGLYEVKRSRTASPSFD